MNRAEIWLNGPGKKFKTINLLHNYRHVFLLPFLNNRAWFCTPKLPSASQSYLWWLALHHITFRDSVFLQYFTIHPSFYLLINNTHTLPISQQLWVTLSSRVVL